MQRPGGMQPPELIPSDGSLLHEGAAAAGDAASTKDDHRLRALLSLLPCDHCDCRPPATSLRLPSLPHATPAASGKVSSADDTEAYCRHTLHEATLATCVPDHNDSSERLHTTT